MTEAADGLRIERRQLFLAVAGAAGAMIVGAFPSRAAEGARMDPGSPASWRLPSAGDLTEAQYVEVVQPGAMELFEDRSDRGQEAYIRFLAAHAAGLGSIPQPSDMKRFGDLDDRIRFKLTHRGRPFVIVHWRMEPGVTFPPHPHPGTNVCTVALEGTSWVTHHDVVGEPDYASDQEFIVVRTRTQRLLPGSISTLCSRRDNIHGFVAGPQGARGMDITTGLGVKLPNPFIEILPTPIDPAGDRYRARWTPPPRSEM